MKLSRRDWLKNASLFGGMTLLTGGAAVSELSAEEVKKFNPRPFNTPIRLGSNENPYGPSAAMRKAMTEAFDNGCRYPWSYNAALQDMIAEREGVTSEHVVLVAGSTEGLKVAGITYAGKGDEIISGLPTFLTMMDYAKVWGADVNWVPLNKDMDYDLEEIEKRITSKTKLVFLCNPNNPTGKLLNKNAVMDFCESACKKTMIFSDEAYYDYIEDPEYPSMIELVKKGENVIVSKTLSKVYGLAGIRMGYLIAKPEIAKMLKERVVANTNIMAIEAGKSALQDEEFYKFSLAKNLECRKMIESTLDELGLDYLPSQANFVFFNAKQDVSNLAVKMLEKGVIIGRPFPPMNNWCRISTGTVEEVAFFNQALKELLV
ncbi:MAG: aminotransferase class I/II-fold pyridoxal phosphate-dependent enzyme [Mongoliibacter sp.]|uniref:pyridoxal phosphate-dependent aminotransferase n=1 Tax=Mongoliibacter sp. TaxID=2022438 RepID=UPI0012EF407D|nr:aminotransferase class I/II-fold pyridoxal phosphate-dependent enzyme [Mongoliibacter sp.]TVP51424.1 MAG: aminotransferase class I/II-fold pyridoxal phosphate-dependent enzyme [Mongoliibacter sp.]